MVEVIYADTTREVLDQLAAGHERKAVDLRNRLKFMGDYDYVNKRGKKFRKIDIEGCRLEAYFHESEARRLRELYVDLSYNNPFLKKKGEENEVLEQG